MSKDQRHRVRWNQVTEPDHNDLSQFLRQTGGTWYLLVPIPMVSLTVLEKLDEKFFVNQWSKNYPCTTVSNYELTLHMLCVIINIFPFLSEVLTKYSFHEHTHTNNHKVYNNRCYIRDIECHFYIKYSNKMKKHGKVHEKNLVAIGIYSMVDNVWTGLEHAW